MAGPNTPIVAPPARPPRYSLFTVAAEAAGVTDTDWVAGFTFDPETCGAGGIEPLPCLGGTGLLDEDTNPANVSGDPYVLYATDVCSTFGFAARDWQGRARRALAAVESYQLAREFWNGDVADAEGLDNRWLAGSLAWSDRVTGSAASIVNGLACIEAGLANQLRGQRGMVHMTPQVLAHAVASDVVFRDGNLWVTPMGHVVVADAGYTGDGPGGLVAGSTQYIYGTDMVSLLLGEVIVNTGPDATTIARPTNDVVIYAQRAAAYVWPLCAHVTAELDIPVCQVGGAS